MSAAYEQVVSRLAITAGETISKYEAVELQGAEAALADGTGIFLGICQYGGDADDVVTVVQGIFPVQTKTVGGITAGTRLKPDSSNPGFFVAATAAEPSCAVNLQALAVNATGSALTVFSPGTDDVV